MARLLWKQRPRKRRAGPHRFSNRDTLPIGLIAFYDDELCGIAALRVDSIATHKHLAPWAAAGLVTPTLRRMGIGGRLVSAVEDIAREMGYAAIYCGTNAANSLLRRGRWQFIERVEYDNNDLSIFRKRLQPLFRNSAEPREAV